MKMNRKKIWQKNYSISDEPNLHGDWLNISLLILLYTLQGLPLGLINSIPLIMQSKQNVSFGDQALFSLVMVPYSLKLAWAPLVDSLYLQKIGRRKSWLVPVQLLIGACFLYISNNIDDMLPEIGKPQVEKLVYLFFVSGLLIVTQDIVVDGWALTMLNKINVGYASMCNSTGLAIGQAIGSVCAIIFTSEEFCNKYLRSTADAGGITTLKSLFCLLAVVYILVTILIGVLKKEEDSHTLRDGYLKLNAWQNYLLLLDILKLRSVQILAIALLTVEIGFATTESLSNLKLIDAGVSKEDITVINTGMYIIKIIVPLVIAKHTSGPKPINVYLKAIIIRLFWNITFVLLIYYTPYMIKSNGHNVYYVPIYYYVILVSVLLIQEILTNTIFVAVISFFSRISDPHHGGTYMTLLNTLSNIGTSWTSFVVLSLVDYLTFKKICSTNVNSNYYSCKLQNSCMPTGSDGCTTTVNGYYVEMIVCTVFGIVWYGLFRNVLKRLQNTSPAHWLVKNNDQELPMTKTTENVLSNVIDIPPDTP